MLPKPVPRNIIRFCIAVGNKNKGFDANHHAAGNFWHNNTAYRNKYNFHMAYRHRIDFCPWPQSRIDKQLEL